MTQWLQLSDDQRLFTLRQAAAASGLPIKAIEKDWWVTLVLQALFQTPYAGELLFKGGTSLSKCWQLIDRFSEDIDLAINRELFGTVNEWSHNQIKKLKKKACTFTSTQLKDALHAQLLALGVPSGMVTITAAEVKATMPDKDPQQLAIAYPSLTDPVAYLADVVTIEVSARSLKEPWSKRAITSMLDEYLPHRPGAGMPFSVPTVEPRRTFLEKAFLLQEEFQKKDGIRHFRMSRHLYDLVKLMDTEHGHSALQDDALYSYIIQHRQQFAFLPWVDYTLHHRETISFIPPESVAAAYEQDYRTMQEQMIYGSPPDFKTLTEKLHELQQRFRQN